MSPDELIGLISGFLRSLPDDCGAVVVLQVENHTTMVQGLRIDIPAAAEVLTEYGEAMEEEK